MEAVAAVDMGGEAGGVANRAVRVRIMDPEINRLCYATVVLWVVWLLGAALAVGLTLTEH